MPADPHIDDGGLRPWRHPEFARMRARIETLEEECAQLRQALRPDFALPAEWRLTAQERTLLLCVYATDGPCPYPRLALALSRDGVAVAHGHVQIVVMRVRDKIGRFGGRIVTHYGHGYTLDPESRAIIGAAIADLRAGRLA